MPVKPAMGAHSTATGDLGVLVASGRRSLAAQRKSLVAAHRHPLEGIRPPVHRLAEIGALGKCLREHGAAVGLDAAEVGRIHAAGIDTASEIEAATAGRGSAPDRSPRSIVWPSVLARRAGPARSGSSMTG